MVHDAKGLTFFLEIRERRIAGIVRNIQAWAERPIEFSQDPYGTPLYSIEETKRAYCRRFIDLSETAHKLIEQDRQIGASILGRSVIETVAIAVFFVYEISRLLRGRNKENFHAKIERFIVGSSVEGASRKPVHIANALRHLQKLDAAYMSYLWNKHPRVHEIVSKSLTSHERDINVKDAIAMVSVVRNYDFLSDFVHPNSGGAFFMYGQPENEGTEQSLVREQLVNFTKSATWHGHHMLRALNETVDQADEYFRLFGSNERPFDGSSKE